MNADELISRGKALLEIKDYAELRMAFSAWSECVISGCRAGDIAIPAERMEQVLLVPENTFSAKDGIAAIRKAALKTMEILSQGEKAHAHCQQIETIALQLKEIPVGFHTIFHGNHNKGETLDDEVLSGVAVNNEYDLQRIVFGFLQIIYPRARTERPEDNGYSSMRADIAISDDLIIELKCTRDTMTEKRLLEELAADASLFKEKNLVVLIYDRVDLLKNSAAYRETLEHLDVKKTIRAVILPEYSFR